MCGYHTIDGESLSLEEGIELHSERDFLLNVLECFFQRTRCLVVARRGAITLIDVSRLRLRHWSQIGPYLLSTSFVKH